MPPWYPFAQSRERKIRRNLRITPVAARAAGVAIVMLVVELLLRLIVTIAGG